MTTANLSQIDELMEQATSALTLGRVFDAERLSDKALRMARQSRSYERMARICLPLQESRRLRMQQALDTRSLTILCTPQGDEPVISAGCFLVQPPLVGADARRYRLAALNQGVPIAIVCREPLTRLGQTPIVAIGQSTIRTRIDPPASNEKPDLKWFVGALEALGDAAIAGVDTGIEPDRQVDALLACLDSHPDHEKLHQALADACWRADEEARNNPPSTRASKASSALDDEDDDDLDGE